VVDGEGRILLPPRSIRQGGEVSFRFGGEDCALRIDRLENLLIGPDCADLQVFAR